jgi:hypothetical protein
MIYSQFQHSAQGVHMALNRRWKYFYSAPDRREYLFDRVKDPDEMRNHAYLPFERHVVNEMRDQLFAFYKTNGETDPIDGGKWREYPQPEFPADPDAGLLIQDAAWARDDQRIPGYTDA